jgi:hypothetical protein
VEGDGGRTGTDEHGRSQDGNGEEREDGDGLSAPILPSSASQGRVKADDPHPARVKAPRWGGMLAALRQAEQPCFRGLTKELG